MNGVFSSKCHVAKFPDHLDHLFTFLLVTSGILAFLADLYVLVSFYLLIEARKSVYKRIYLVIHGSDLLHCSLGRKASVMGYLRKGLDLNFLQ